MEKKTTLPTTVSIAIITLLLALSGYLFFKTQAQSKELGQLRSEKDSALLETGSTTKTFLTERELASSTISDLSRQLALITEELEDTEEDYERERNRNEEFEEQIDKISGTVGILDKLSKTDKELLQKYSRTYFLNENFVPMKLSQIKSEYILPGRKDQYFHGNAVKFLSDMLDDAKEAGHDIKVVSAYRSFDEQMALKGQYTQIYGSGSNAFSADQGYSEHQLGTTLDLTDPTTGGAYLSFAQTPAYAWLVDNAYRYGFILSYPEGNNFYIYEPWHWRFVGQELARDLRKDNVHFYDWDQRTIDEYLVKIFD